MIPRRIFLCCLTLWCYTANGQVPGEWTWMKGDSTANQHGHFGTKGVADTDNCPPALYQSCGATDHNGNFWLFGGANFFADGTPRYYNTLWKYDVSTNEWTWMKGLNDPSGLWNSAGLGIADDDNTPGARYKATMWVDSADNLWLFGGYGDGYIGIGALGDLWKYSIADNQWTWVNSSGTANRPPVWGQQGVPDTANLPPTRCEAASWIDHDGNLWIFGGRGNYWGDYYSDLWRYNISTHEWTWMKGSTHVNQYSINGTLGVMDSISNPGSRTCQTHWVDSLGNFWLFGGYAMSVGTDDLWEYLPSENNWIYWGGTTPGIPIQNDGVLCVPDSLNHPPAREECAFVWNTGKNLWMFGGIGSCLVNYNVQSQHDLWKLYLDSKIWVRVSGADCYQSPLYNQLQVSSPDNSPGSRFGGVSFQDSAGNFWVFGGSKYEIVQNYTFELFNDLWRYVPDSACGVYTSSHAVKPDAWEVFPNPANDAVLIQFPASPGAVLTVFNSIGRPVFNSSFSGHQLVEVAAWTPGIYWVQICSQEGCSVQPLVVSK